MQFCYYYMTYVFKNKIHNQIFKLRYLPTTHQQSLLEKHRHSFTSKTDKKPHKNHQLNITNRLLLLVLGWCCLPSPQKQQQRNNKAKKPILIHHCVLLNQHALMNGFICSDTGFPFFTSFFLFSFSRVDGCISPDELFYTLSFFAFIQIYNSQIYE